MLARSTFTIICSGKYEEAVASNEDSGYGSRACSIARTSSSHKPRSASL